MHRLRLHAVARAAVLSLALLALSGQPTVGAAAEARASMITTSDPAVAATCSHLGPFAQTVCLANATESLKVSLPAGADQCPASAAGVACGFTSGAKPDVGVASTPTSVDTGSASGAPKQVSLALDSTTAVPGHNVTLTATADASVTGTNRALEIFDTSTGKLLGACSTGNQCSVGYAARSGRHTFRAFVAAPTKSVPNVSSAIASKELAAAWIGLSAALDRSAIAPGQPMTLTVTSSLPVDKTGWLLQIYDAFTRSRLTYCAAGNTCSMTLTQLGAGARGLVAVLAPPSPTAPNAGAVVAQTDVVTMSWLAVAVRAVTNNSQPGGVIHVIGSVNADLTNTGWSLGLFDDHGQLIAPLCNKGTSCSADITIKDAMPSFRAAVGTAVSANDKVLGQLFGKVGDGIKLTNLQANTGLVVPMVHTARLLWGVDSCKKFTDGIYPQVANGLGMPDFWGRYLTNTVCPGIGVDEVSAARTLHMGILPIFNDFNCSAVSGYDTGRQYAASAVAAARSLGIPNGVALVIDIEPPGDACPGAANVDGGFIQGWYDGVIGGNYTPAYYGNGGIGSAFANAYCAAVADRPEVANNSQLWTYEPSLWGGYSKSNVPDWGLAYNTHCPENGSAWQYMLSAGSTPDVDHDLVGSDFPLWYP